MRPADSDVCQSRSVHQPRPSALSSLSLSSLGRQQLSFTIHPPTCLILIMSLIKNLAQHSQVDLVKGCDSAAELDAV